MWKLEIIPGAGHVVPVNDIIQHTLDDDCECGPRVEWINPDTDLPYSEGRLVIHNSADQRENEEALNLDELIRILNGFKIPFANELEMQNTIERILKHVGIPHLREFQFTPKDRIDFLVGRIGIECKVDGSKMVVARQLMRYAERPEIDALLLVTSRSTHVFPSNLLLGKPFKVYRVRTL